MEESPEFFKIYTTQISNRLKIPESFTKYFRGASSGSSCTLKGPSGRVWKVYLTQNSDAGLFLEEGWPVFVKDHSIEMGDCLVFTYDQRLSFQVKIYGAKESAFEAIGSQDTSSNGKKKATSSQDTSSNGKRKAIDSDDTSSNESNGKRKAIDSDDTSSNESNGKKKKANNGKRKANKAKYNRWDYVSMEEAAAKAAGRRGGLISQRRNVTVNEIEKAKDAANKFTSKNPFFKIVMRASHVYYGFTLTIPSSFWRKHLSKCSEDMFLHNPQQETWSVPYHFDGKINRAVLSKGWVGFSEYNNIEADDVCVFELIEKNQMKVHIFRVVEETRPLIKNTREFREGQGSRWERENS